MGFSPNLPLGQSVIAFIFLIQYSHKALALKNDLNFKCSNGSPFVNSKVQDHIQIAAYWPEHLTIQQPSLLMVFYKPYISSICS